MALRRALNFVRKVCQNGGHVFVAPAPLRPQGGRLVGCQTATKTWPGTSPRGDENNMIATKERSQTISRSRMQARPALVAAIAGNSNKEKRLFIPEALVLLSLGRSNQILIKEAIKSQIPLVGVPDTDPNPFGIQSPTPGNDDSFDSIELYTKSSIEAVDPNRKTQVIDVGASLSLSQ